LKKNFAQIRLVVFEKSAKNAHFNSENDVTDPKARLPVSGFWKPWFTEAKNGPLSFLTSY